MEYAAKGAAEVIADDTDIFILLLHHRKKNMNITMKTKQKIIDFKVIQDKLGEELWKCVLFAHAISGCDTTFGMFSIGKLKAFKLLRANEMERNVILFGDDANLDELTKKGEHFIICRL